MPEAGFEEKREVMRVVVIFAGVWYDRYLPYFAAWLLE